MLSTRDALRDQRRPAPPDHLQDFRPRVCVKTLQGFAPGVIAFAEQPIATYNLMLVKKQVDIGHRIPVSVSTNGRTVDQILWPLSEPVLIQR